MALERTRYYRVLYRPQLILGCDKGLMACSFALCGGILITGGNLQALVMAAAVWLVALPLLRRATKVDPYIRDIYARGRRYRGYYPPRSRPYRVDPKTMMKNGRM